MAGLWIRFYNYLFLKISQAIEGKVVGIDTTSTADSTIGIYMPIIEYTNPLGEKKQFITSITSLNSGIGNRVGVAHHPPKSKVKLISLVEIFLLFTIMCLFDLVLLLSIKPNSIVKSIVIIDRF